MPPPERKPVPVPAVLPEMVVLRTVRLPFWKTLMPPPSPLAELPMTTESVTVALIREATKMPPPERAGRSAALTWPPVIVRPERVVLAVRVKMRNWVAAAGSRRTVMLAAPGPVMVTGLVTSGRAVAKVMVPVRPAWKVMVSAPAAALASVIACRSVPAPVSARVVTGKFAGAVRSSRQLSSSRVRSPRREKWGTGGRGRKYFDTASLLGVGFGYGSVVSRARG
jgi:hypothetical protein